MISPHIVTGVPFRLSGGDDVSGWKVAIGGLPKYLNEALCDTRQGKLHEQPVQFHQLYQNANSNSYALVEWQEFQVHRKWFFLVINQSYLRPNRITGSGFDLGQKKTPMDNEAATMTRRKQGKTIA